MENLQQFTLKPGVQVSVTVDAPLEKCYEIWADRINYMEWFTFLVEVGRPLSVSWHPPA